MRAKLERIANQELCFFSVLVWCYGIILKNNKADDEKAIYMLKSIVLITAVLSAVTHAQAGTLGVGYVLDCNPLEQQFIVGEQVNNQLPITNPQILRFAVLTDRSLQVKSLDKSKKNLSQNNAQYAGEAVSYTHLTLPTKRIV